jgi:hypothetical protein
MKLLTPDQLSLEAFLPCLKTRFRVILDPVSFVELELQEAKALSLPGQVQSPVKAPGHESFSLILLGPDSRFLPQRTYAFEHDQIGRFEMFIVPIAQKPGFFEYQVIFNRLAKQG